MKHYSLADWLAYIEGEADAHQQAEMEDHLYSCAECLDLYSTGIEINEEHFPGIQNPEFTDYVMQQINFVKGRGEEDGNTVSRLIPNEKPYYRNQVFHYIVAAAATLLLMFSGVFQSITAIAGNIDSQTKNRSYTEGIITKTFAWMDSLEKNKEDEQ
ncbi:anti-sigma factor family protein [Bacillus sp. B-jedd]|uniref:anti-sigma factor family protein n=1 Tax=Bacillus sp. B-jedd TaxID=1476857 RepID=UPI0005156A29|nr:zf-HC2 domain-containing protein [Bacillus sp. B-jedd]CEG26383.1 group-specific protein [Bacillus sp. B-jedd]